MDTPTWKAAIYGFVMASVAAIWFTVVSVFFSNPVSKHFFQRHQLLIDRILGALIAAFGISLAFASP